MSELSINTNVRELECPWCGQKGVVDYEDFEEGNGAESEAECGNCEKPLHTQVNYEFWIRKP